MQPWKLATAAAVAAAVMAGDALANVLTITGNGRGDDDCTPSCEGFTGAGSPGEPTGPGILSATTAG